MPTLLSINNYYYYRGGAETVFLEHNRMFEAMGWKVVPFAMKHAKNLDTPWSKYFVEEIEFGEQYSLREKLVRIPKVIYSLEARRNLERVLARAPAGRLSRTQHLPSHLTLHFESPEAPRNSDSADAPRSEDCVSRV